MQKIWRLLIIMIVSLSGCGEDKFARYDQADVLFFTQQGCSHCQKAEDYIWNKLQPKHPELKIIEVDVSYDRDNIDILRHYLQKYNFKGTQVGTPIIIFKQQLLMGWSFQNRVRLQRAFAKD